MQQGLGFIHVIIARTCMEVQHLQVDGFHCLRSLHHSMCGPMKDNQVTIFCKLLHISGFSHVHTPLHNCGDSDI